MNKYKHIGVVLAVVTLATVFAGNVLLNVFFDINIDRSNNGLPYYINLILILLILVGYIRFQYLHKNLILFVISTFVLQNLLISAVVDLSQRNKDYDIFNDFSFLIAMPVAIIGMVAWGITFDFLRNKITSGNNLL